VANVCGIVITTNHKTDGIYLPADDRRHYVAWSDLTKEDFTDAYWRKLWGWYGDGGDRHVAAYLQEYDLSEFDAKAPPPKTEAFYAVVDVGRSPEEAEMADALDVLDNTDAVTLNDIILAAGRLSPFGQWLTDRKNRRAIPHRLDACGYVPERNPEAKDGLWRVMEERQVIYVRKEMTRERRRQAAEERMRRERERG
jgi:hypothetical protein